MGTRHAIVLLGSFGFGLFGFATTAGAQDFSIDDVSAARKTDVAQLKSGTIAFSDHTGSGAVDSETALIAFDDWTSKQPAEKKFLALFPSYAEPTITKTVNGNAAQITDKLSMYVAQARFILDRAPDAVDLSHDVTLPFLEKIDPAISHKQIVAADVVSF